jgi:hypothetical protein
MDSYNKTCTPGPWSLEDNGGDACSVVNREHNGLDWDVCTVHSSYANASLIAAAPDLLEACLLAHAYLSTTIFDCSTIVAAIKKAEGL